MCFFESKEFGCIKCYPKGSRMGIGSLNQIVGVRMGDTLPKSQPDRRQTAEIVRAVRALNDSKLFGSDTEVTFRWDSESHQPIVRVVKSETGDLIQQIPSEQILRIMTAMENQRKERNNANVE